MYRHQLAKVLMNRFVLVTKKDFILLFLQDKNQLINHRATSDHPYLAVYP